MAIHRALSWRTFVPVSARGEDRGGEGVEGSGASGGGMFTWEPLLPHLVGGFRVITPDSRGHGRPTNPSGRLSYAQIADDVAALIASLGLVRPVVGGYSDVGQIALELAARHPGAARALIVGAAYPDFVSTGLRRLSKAFLGIDQAGMPDLAQVDTHLGDFAGVVKAWHAGGDAQWRALVQQTAPMWLDYEGLTADEIRGIQAPALVFAGDRDEQEGRLDLAVSLYRVLLNGELGICPNADHFGPITPNVLACTPRSSATSRSGTATVDSPFASCRCRRKWGNLSGAGRAAQAAAVPIRTPRRVGEGIP